MDIRNLLLSVFPSLIATAIWESFKFILNKNIVYNMEHAGITNFWFILFFISVNLLFFLLYYRKTKQSKAQEDSIEASKESFPKEPHVYDILDDCVWDDTLGCYRNPITNELFCSDCWGDHKIKKHLTKINLSQWVCQKCNRIYNSRLSMWKDLFMKNPRTSVIRRHPEK